MAKQLFNSTEKSNFILNLTEEKYSKLAAWGLLAACFTTSLAAIIPECSTKVTYAIVASAGLTLSGILCMIFTLIAFMKGYVEKRTAVPVAAFGAVVMWAAVSMINSFDFAVGLNGFPGRGEGFLAILFYFSFFVTGISVKREKTFMVFIWGMIAAGILNSVWGLIQVFTGEIGSFTAITSEKYINAASGLAQSPLFLAMLLSLSLTAAMVGTVLFDSRISRIICLISSCLFSFVMVFTYSFIGFCGLAFAVIAAVAAVISSKKAKARIASVLAVIVPAAVGIVLVQAGAVGNVDGYALHDGRMLWWADSFLRLSSSGEPDSSVVDMDDTYDVYYTLNSKTLNIISNYPITGTGPDQLVYPQLYKDSTIGGTEEDDITNVILTNKGTFDRVYNEYLYTAATRGIPSLIALVVLLLAALVLSFRNMKRKNSVTGAVFFAVTLCGVLLFLVGCSNTAFSPIFWAASGAGCVELNRKVR